MNENLQPEVVDGPLAQASRQTATGRDPSWALLRWMLVTATAWYLLKELAPLFRPLLLAVFLAYIILPVHLYVKGQVHGGARRLTLLAGWCAALTESAWETVEVRDGEKGPLVVQVSPPRKYAVPMHGNYFISEGTRRRSKLS